jgi:hypothetical protein
MEEKGCSSLIIVLFALFIFFILCMDKRREPDPIYIPSSTKSTGWYNPETNHKIAEGFTPSTSKARESKSPYVFDDDDDYDNPDYDIDDVDELENY